MEQFILLSILALLPLFLQLIGLTFAVAVDPYIRKEDRRIMLVIVALVYSLVVQNYLEYILGFNAQPVFARTLTSIYGYSIRPLIIVLFGYIVSKNRNVWFGWILIGVNTLVHLTALFSPICFEINEENHFARGPLGYCCHVVSVVLLVWLLYLTSREFMQKRKIENWIPMLNAVAIVGAIVLDLFAGGYDWPASFLTIAVVSCSVFYYIWLHLQFVRQHEKALMAEQRIQLMMSQIQPHFMYNTLSTIQALCRIDPDKAYDTIQKFSIYLRQNIDSLSQPELIPLEKELQHTKVYADIEEVRFPDIDVIYNTEDSDFEVPALTIQPLVENAIRHGIRGLEGGRVMVTTRRKGEFHEIIVADNGRGFDVNVPPRSDGTHIGMQNVRERIETICGGTFTIESRPRRGTTITIRIPVERPALAETESTLNLDTGIQ